ncbi:NAD(P)H nitroreductase [Blastococcus sp. CT_GayMR19]|uniref:Acg family FMN-binding oxidoreductase n=1 Tax=Blastococcus sp. CT_GayMR19 TaxID=2559608 RepID=UPI0010733360|nr:NAD(P)H nitroreductase [Blastococcus sp. CT_GayMR19]TFV71014.1 NAD(P)H nitroreductase [Blastococcus sp. CT_GayMR19]
MSQESSPSTAVAVARPLQDSAADALSAAVDRAMLAPSLHNSQPWRFTVHADGLDVLADRTRHLTSIDPLGRELVQSVGAALFNARVTLAAHGWAVDVQRCPSPDDPDLLAVLHLIDGPPDPGLAVLDRLVPRRRTNRRTFDATVPTAAELRSFTAAAVAEGSVLVPVLTGEQHRLVARLTQEADAQQRADPAYLAELARWTSRAPAAGDGIVAAAVPHVDGSATDDVPMRDFDTRGDGALPPSSGMGTERTMLVLGTRSDGVEAWLRSGEALQHVLLTITQAGWAASPFTQCLEIPTTRTRLRAGLTWDTWPQSVLRIGHAGPTGATPRRQRADVVSG